MRASDVKIEWDEDGLHLIIDGDSPDPEYQAAIVDYLVEDPEQLYDRVKAAILPWLMERDEALREYRLMGAAVEADMRAVAIREDGSLRMEPDEEPDNWRERLAGNADWSRKVAKGE
jgi:hypothetical protein